VLGNVMFNPVTWACTAMLARQPDGFEQIGALNVANQWFGALLWLPYVMDQASLPMLAERLAANDRVRATKLLVASVKIAVTTTLPFVVVGSLLSRHIMAAYGRDFVQDWPTLVLSLATGVVVSIQVVVGTAIAASGRMWLGFGMNLLWAV